MLTGIVEVFLRVANLPTSTSSTPSSTRKEAASEERYDASQYKDLKMCGCASTHNYYNVLQEQSAPADAASHPRAFEPVTTALHRDSNTAF